MDALTCWNMECVLAAELQKLPAPHALTVGDFLQEGTLPLQLSNTDSSDAVVVDGCSNSGELKY